MCTFDTTVAQADKMSLKDKTAPSKRDYFADAIKQLQSEMEANPKWDYFLTMEKCAKLQSDYEKFEAKNVAIRTDGNADAQQLRECDLMRVEIEAIYFKLKPQLKRWISMHESEQKEKSSTIEAQSTHTQNENVDTQKVSEEKCDDDAHNSHQLKTMTISKPFNASLNDWLEFHEKFKGYATDEKLSDEQKMIELVQVCTPELLQALNTTGFEETWNKLMRKFNDKYTLTTFYLRKLQNLEVMAYATAESIEKLLSEAKNIKKAFEQFGEKLDEKSLIFAIVSKLDVQTQRAWNRYRNILAESWALSEQKKTWEHMPTLEMLFKFLDDEKEIYASEVAAALPFNKQRNEMIDALSSDDNQSYAKVAALPIEYAHTGAIPKANRTQITQSEANAQNFKCMAECENKAFHPLFKCPKFLIMHLESRIAIISKHNICMKCFRTDHAGDCLERKSNYPCERCKPSIVYHNSSICPNNPHIARPMPKQIQHSNASNADDDWN